LFEDASVVSTKALSCPWLLVAATLVRDYQEHNWPENLAFWHKLYGSSGGTVRAI